MTEQSNTPAPECRRHPGRVSYVRCQRCGRPTCTECQRPAAVGVQCVTCVQEAARNAPPSHRTPYGGELTDDRPVVTIGLIAVCVVVWIVQMISQRTNGGQFTEDFAFAPSVGWSQPWRFVTGSFLHSTSSLMHITFNMLALWSVGQYLEKLIGRWRFLALYLVSGIAGNVCVTWLATPPNVLSGAADPSWFTAVVGASGAVFGLFGAFVVLQRHLGMDFRPMLFVIGINAVIGFVVPGIAWQAHLGGLVAGVACAGAIARLKAPQLRRYQWPALAGVAVLVLALGVGRYLMLDPLIRAIGS